MDEDNVTCQICLEKYDTQDKLKLPKKLPCCGKVFCFNCLNDIYKRKQNSILCPICRKTTTKNPNDLMTDNSVFADFITCPNCNQKIIKSELFINFENMSLKCIKCQKGDMTLDSFLPSIVEDLSDFLNVYQKNVKDIHKIVEMKIRQNLDDFFNKLKQNLTNQLINIIYSEIKKKYSYDIIKDNDNYIKKMNGLSSSLKTMNNYITNEGNEKFDVNKLKSQILYWSQNMESVRTDCNKYESVIKVVDIQTPLFELRKDIRVEELQQFFMNVFQPILVEKKTTRQTGIKIFDSNVNVATASKIVNSDEVNALKKEKSNLVQQINNLKSIIQNKDDEIERINSNRIVNGDLKVNNEEPIYDFGMNRTDIIRRINLFEDDE